MKVYKTQSAVEKDIKDGVLTIEGDVSFECSISILASIKVICGDIDAWNINAKNINAKNINAKNINAKNINAWNIDARDIDARDIDAWNINAKNINAKDILYYAFCSVYNSIKCLSIKAKREVHSEPICLDGELTIKTEQKETIKIGNQTYNKDEVEQALKDVKSL
jgi:hypothetical protein